MLRCSTDQTPPECGDLAGTSLAGCGGNPLGVARMHRAGPPPPRFSFHHCGSLP